MAKYYNLHYKSHNMTSQLITLLTFIVTTYFLVRKIAKSSTKKTDCSINPKIGIPMTKQDIDLERQTNEEVIKLLEISIATSGFFRVEKIPELVANLKGGYTTFGRVNTAVAFDGDIFLTVEEKKLLGLNSRMKYSKKFIEYFDPLAFKMIEPKSTLERMHLNAYHRISQKNELLKLKKLGSIKKVKIVATGDGNDCKKIKRFKKIYNIEEVPELPIPNCEEFCRCYYEAHSFK